MKQYQADRYIGPGRTVGVISANHAKTEALHCHDFIEIVYIRSGSAVHRIDGADYDVSRGDILFINYGATHAFHPREEGFRYINICFLPEGRIGNALALLSLTVFDEMRREQSGGKLSFSGQDREEVEDILEAMLREHKSEEAYAQQMLEGYLNILLTKMLRKSLAATAADGDVWQALEQYICNNLDSQLTLSALARRCFYNPSYFSRAFKQRMGCSLSEYIRLQRMEQARKLMTETELPVESVMARVGYADRSAFYRAFSETTGLTPAQYRLLCKNGLQQK